MFAMEVYDKIQEAVAYIRSKTGFVPEVGIVLGSGLGPLAEEVAKEAEIPYGEIPHFPLSTAPGHAGRLILGELEGKRVLVYQGRVHYYEGYSAEEVVFPVRVGYFLGAKTFILTSAAGGLNPRFRAGGIMLHLDYINFAGTNPLRGKNDERLGPRFPVMFEAYDPGLIELARKVARKQDLHLFEGVYAWFMGPSFASRAELKVLRDLGADAIGMSTVPEVIALRHLGARVLGLSTITDMAVPERERHATEEEVLAVAAKTGPIFRRFVRGILAEL
ncbi:purine-nucleoside phosphorylase [Thermus scotoductus]|uniref:Purine nucleoside phosphorylase n=1 Tax=Thermus scotoductus TaxID=37636 RepID=A0A430S4G7_THESC|nr:purine-nucleoside phosphorylase [Thermus scotoductus]RTG91713.1 purine-nucleoside phosphorylase [Thermus scotoductus]RTH28818.1 purine-nucleoside phosphorylase [Thermus scotoductus]